jgi:hypothetical protein
MRGFFCTARPLAVFGSKLSATSVNPGLEKPVSGAWVHD